MIPWNIKAIAHRVRAGLQFLQLWPPSGAKGEESRKVHPHGLALLHLYWRKGSTKNLRKYSPLTGRRTGFTPHPAALGTKVARLVTG